MAESDVSIRRLYKRFGNLVAVDHVDLEVPSGAFVTFLGPSGCGKTTTLRMIGGFEHPDSGQILIKGEEMGNRPPHRRDTSMVFQNYALFPHMSVADNIGFGLRERKVPKSEIRERVQRMLELVELTGRGDRKPRQLSGGQQQRVALARSLVIEPTVLLLDEPLGALDLQLRKQMQIELKRIQQQVGITFIYVTHDQEEALTMSDRIVVMNDGRVEQEGDAEEIFENPRTRFVAEFMGAENVLDADVADRDGSSARLRIGTRELTLPKALPDGARTAAVVVRPEKVRMDVPDGWRGTVTDRVYKGATMSYLIRLDDGTIVNADVAHDDPAHRHDVGDEMMIAFRPEDIVVIPDTKGA
ncbi:MAG TPA: ABC transporter ATP-binding protein [Thermomicrobiales bacterium]|nr:ABC transporter ATP-binding protein [Thermomicrobiales bacterium]